MIFVWISDINIIFPIITDFPPSLLSTIVTIERTQIVTATLSEILNIPPFMSRTMILWLSNRFLIHATIPILILWAAIYIVVRISLTFFDGDTLTMSGTQKTIVQILFEDATRLSTETVTLHTPILSPKQPPRTLSPLLTKKLTFPMGLKFILFTEPENKPRIPFFRSTNVGFVFDVVSFQIPNRNIKKDFYDITSFVKMC